MRVIKYTQGLQDESFGYNKHGEAFVSTSVNSKYFLNVGDYVIVDNGSAKVVTKDEALGNFFNQSIREQKGKELVNDLFKKLKEQNLTDSEEAQIINKIATTIVALLAGSLRGAKIICNALTTDSVFTNGRKNYLIGQIDAAIAGYGF